MLLRISPVFCSSTGGTNRVHGTAGSTGDRRALGAAIDTHEQTRSPLADHSRLLTERHPIPSGEKSHERSMIFALCYDDLAGVRGRDDIMRDAVALAEIVVSLPIDREARIPREFVTPGDGVLGGDAGATYIPGHAIESMWFMQRTFGSAGKIEVIDLCINVIRWHVERGWYWRVHEYSFEVFPDAEHGEWHQDFGRKGRMMPVVVRGLSVKDPFRLPGSPIYARKTLKRLTS